MTTATSPLGLQALRVFHLKRESFPSSQSEIWPYSDFTQARVRGHFPGVFLDSCQRHLWIGMGEQWDSVQELFSPLLSMGELLSGSHAYAFLLQVASGLESQVLGETDIFGQFKQALKECGVLRDSSEARGVLSLISEEQQELSFWMRKVLEDTKDIRSQSVHHLGGASYGSIARMILGRESRRVLILGAGQIAQSIAPYFLPSQSDSKDSSELWLMNRSEEKLQPWLRDLESRLAKRAADQKSPSLGRIRALTWDQEVWALENADLILVCIPADHEQDRLRIQILLSRLESSNQDQRSFQVLHFGGGDRETPSWQKLNRRSLQNDLGQNPKADLSERGSIHGQSLKIFSNLSDLFLLQESQNLVRSQQVEAARKLCLERALLRNMGASLAIPHGWEDLAAFL